MTQETDISNKIQSVRDELTPSQKVVADYVLSDPMGVAFSTIKDISTKLDVSTATVVRFADKLGYLGFSRFQNALKDSIQNRNNAVVRFESSLQYGNGSNDDLITDICNLQIKSLNNLMSQSMNANYHNATELINKANHIYVIGIRGSYTIAYYLGHHFNRIFGNTDIISDLGRLPDYLLRMKSGDVVIVVNLPRYSAQLVKFAKAAKDAQAKVIVITDSAASPYCKYQDVLLRVNVESSDYHNSILPSMMVAEILISLICKTNIDTVRSQLSKMEPLFEELDTFVR